jgi:dolichol-phosphate mannosyltransferase
VILPTYNEADNIGAILAALLAVTPPLDVLVVDDNSPDGTGDLVQRAAQAHPGRIHILTRGAKGGLGDALRCGFGWALARNYSTIVQMDADGSHPVVRLPAMLDKVAKGADLAVGSRYVPGGATVNWPLRRRWLSRSGNFYARRMLRLDLRDVTGGFRAWRASSLAGLEPLSMHTRGYGFTIQLAAASHRHGLSCVEVPIVFKNREKGMSKMSAHIAIEAVTLVLSLCLERALSQSSVPSIPGETV